MEEPLDPEYVPSPAERRVLQALVQVDSLKQAAVLLDCSIRTVEKHLEHMYVATGVHSRHRLLAMARSKEWIVIKDTKNT